MTTINIVKISGNSWIVMFGGLELSRYFSVENALDCAAQVVQKGHGPLVVNMVGCAAHEVDHIWDWEKRGVILTYDTETTEYSVIITSNRSLVYIAPEGAIEVRVKGIIDCLPKCEAIYKEHPELSIYVELGDKMSLPMDLERFRSFIDYFVLAK